MASTSNKNTTSDYCLERRQNRLISDFVLNPRKRIAYKTKFPCFGINVGQVPNTQLSCNPIDTESFLYGINSSNLVKPQGPFTADIKCAPGITFYPKLQTYLPRPLVIPKCQRPVGPFC